MDFKLEKIPATFSQLLEICSYQQELLTKYEEFIENQIVSKIKEEDFNGDRWRPDSWASFKRITIPETSFMLRCDPSTLKAWEWLKFQKPVFEPELYIKAAFIEEGENNAKTD